MDRNPSTARLQNGTLVRHKSAGYCGRIDGITELKQCFTSGGQTAGKNGSAYKFQYRVLVAGEVLRRIAPEEDMEILEGVVEVLCGVCGHGFASRPGMAGKPGGRCECGGWICPSCLSCRAQPGLPQAICSQERKRLARKGRAQKQRLRA
ncbi:MAG TPA: hypothetical protein VNN77_10200 [candidate division Zixibacteria bacterium]|nr:hypothetical protein [candidate division Zixibacteria bacterium]